MTISFARHQFPPAIIQHGVWLYVRFTLSYRDVEDLLAERGLDVSYETVRRWVLKFGPLFARELRHRRPRPTSRWHLDEMAVTIAGRQFWLWRAGISARSSPTKRITNGSSGRLPSPQWAQTPWGDERKLSAIHRTSARRSSRSTGPE